MDILVCPKQCEKLMLVKLPDPKSGKLKQYFYDEDNLALYETTKYNNPHRSWFLDEMFCKEGHLNLLIKVDPLLIFLPILMELAKEQFRSLHDICSTYASKSNGSDRLDFALSPEIQWNQVGDIKDLDGELFLRFNLNKTLDWLLIKHERTMKALQAQLTGQPSKATLISYASDLIDMYLPSSISDNLKTRAKNNSIIGGDTTSASAIKPKTAPKRSTSESFDNPKTKPGPTILNFFKKP